MTTKRLMKALVDGKELICKWEMRGNEPVEPIYAKLNNCGELSFRHKDSSYLIDNFGNLFPQFYPFTRITSRDWKVVQEVKPIQWYESLPVARIDSDGYTIFTKAILCNARPNFVIGDIDHLVLLTGYKWFNNKTIVKFCTQSETVISSTGILPLNDMQLPNYLSNFNLGTF